ncbi:MAG TPA: ABATE domain-containing protein [Dyella sp.]|uniref:CGNR zinc finger domain-containing protein n=1 Tax=Dyella sp. TaxID=1869338 RepID=UPI002C3FAB3F|nr:ABATE domain-containing protein [Dyella sp.]HTV87175.1 ABATE domain-containing protein [Dyella sp.]
MPNHSFQFNGGRLSLDLAGTLRIRACGTEDELELPGTPGRWLDAAALTDGEMLLSESQEAELRALRDAIKGTIEAARSQRPLPGHYVAMLNRAATVGIPAPWLDTITGLSTHRTHRPFKAALSLLARDAIKLVSGPDLRHVKACALSDCRALFLDESQSCRRRWCSMDRCGSRAKVTAFRERRKTIAHAR